MTALLAKAGAAFFDGHAPDCDENCLTNGMLDEARQSAGRDGVALTWLQCDALYFSLPLQVDAAISENAASSDPKRCLSLL